MTVWSSFAPKAQKPDTYLTQSFWSCLTEMSGTAADISLVHWRQQWLENGTLYFHVSMSSSGQLSQATAPTLQEPSEIVEEQMHILHISVMVSGCACDEGGDRKKHGIVHRWENKSMPVRGQCDLQKIRWILCCCLDWHSHICQLWQTNFASEEKIKGIQVFGPLADMYV